MGVAGRVDVDAVIRDIDAAFSAMPAGSENVVAAPDYIGGVAARRQTGSSQTHVVLGYPIPSLTEDYYAGLVAAAVFGEGMSSPLMDELRERRGLVYYAACSADISDLCGQFVIEASMAPQHLNEFFQQVSRMLIEHAEAVHPEALERACNQIEVRNQRNYEKPFRRLEDAAQDLWIYGRVRIREEVASHVNAVTSQHARAAFERMLSNNGAVAIAGQVRKFQVEDLPTLIRPD